MQKPQITEIQVRMDCNGCVQKMKKALNGINGIYDLYIDFPQQKMTIVGWADPEKIVKAIKRTRKTATICSHVEPMEPPSQPPEPEPEENNAPALEPTQQSPAEAPLPQADPQSEPPKDTPPPEQPPPEATVPTENNAGQQSQSIPGTKDVGKVHEIYRYPPNYANRFSSGHNYVGCWDKYHNSPAFPQEPPPPIYVTHSYNTYKPSPYVTEYEYVRSPPRHYSRHSQMEYYSGDYQNGNGNITSIFSDENPNACTIV
ncbi:heavy metal-associated isoprenylated plant protein 5-like [Senna tora]|uniref:Heavy metal-associated isoprenylated plant protein 5-like n=1 Tax=Senna tora TaxID=362788 RepID=A0A834WDT4_9FABA|nr:heavy metal-associated isoprenylated plant protein 5-like [Senna tora]